MNDRNKQAERIGGHIRDALATLREAVQSGDTAAAFNWMLLVSVLLEALLKFLQGNQSEEKPKHEPAKK